MNKISPSKVSRIVADYASGMSLAATARKHKVAEATAHRYVKAAGVSRTLSEAKAVEYAALRGASGNDEAELTGGRWVRVGLVERWQPGLAVVAEPIVCPCGARLSDPCRTVSGNPTRHADRIIDRRCPCGNVLPAGYHYCTNECRRLARAATYRRREQRTPTRERRAA